MNDRELLELAGKALRLAVKLSLLVNVDGGFCETIDDSGSGCIVRADDGNVCAATRRAIVRAAAEIAKSQAHHEGEKA